MEDEPARRENAPSMMELKRLVLKQQEAWVSRVLYRRLSVPITWILVRTSATPNGVTWASAVVGLVALVAIADPLSRWSLILAGLALFQAAIVLDHVDGELARAKKLPSPGGWFLDNFVMEVFLHLGLAAALGASAYFLAPSRPMLGVAAAFVFLKALNLATFFLKAVSHLRNPTNSPALANLPTRPGLRTFIGPRYWEVKKLANASTLLLAADLGLRVAGIHLQAAGLPFTLLGAFLAVGVAWLAISLFLDVRGAARGRFAVDLDPYR